MAQITWDDGTVVVVPDSALRPIEARGDLVGAVPLGLHELRKKIASLEGALAMNPRQPTEILLSWARANNPHEVRCDNIEREIAAAKEELKKWP